MDTRHPGDEPGTGLNNATLLLLTTDVGPPSSSDLQSLVSYSATAFLKDSSAFAEIYPSENNSPLASPAPCCGYSPILYFPKHLKINFVKTLCENAIF